LHEESHARAFCSSYIVQSHKSVPTMPRQFWRSERRKVQQCRTMPSLLRAPRKIAANLGKFPCLGFGRGSPSRPRKRARGCSRNHCQPQHA
jgi:hypothetical protein